MINIPKNAIRATVAALVEPMRKHYPLNPDNAYHTINHIRLMLVRCLINASNIIKAFPELGNDQMWYHLITAILWHDAGYKPGCPFNEINAAHAYVQAHGENASPIVVNAILSTVIGTERFNNSLETVLHDLDWWSFSDYATLENDEESIYTEYLITVLKPGEEVTLEIRREYLTRRVAFYKSLLQHDVFVSPLMAPLNQQAALNIEKRISELEVSIQIIDEDINNYGSCPF